MRGLKKDKVCHLPPDKLRKMMSEWGVKYTADYKANMKRCQRTYKAYTEKKWYKGAERDLSLKGLQYIAKRYKVPVKRTRQAQIEALMEAGKELKRKARVKRARAKKRAMAASA